MVPHDALQRKENNCDFDHAEFCGFGRLETVHQVYSGAVQMRRRLA